MGVSPQRSRIVARRPPKRVSEYRPVRMIVNGQAHWAYVNVIPGIIATGATRTEARANLERAISEAVRKKFGLRRWPLLERIQARGRAAGWDKLTPDEVDEVIRVARAEGRARLP